MNLDLINTLHFIRPLWLWTLPVVGILLVFLSRPRASADQWIKACDPHLLKALSVGQNSGKNRAPLILFTLATTLTAIALAGPSWDKRELPIAQIQSARIIVLDLSLSMMSGDLKPSRVERAKFKITDFLNNIDEGQVGFVAFAQRAFVVSPLTSDANTILALLAALDPSIMPAQGSRADLGLQQAADLLSQAGQTTGHIILFSDSVDQRTINKASTINQSGIQVSVVGVGTVSGAPVPLPGGGFLKDSGGNIVIPKLNHRKLSEVAAAGGGIYSVLSADQQDIRRLFNQESTLFELKNSDQQSNSSEWNERGPWLVLCILPFAAMAFRRGWLLTLLMITVTQPQPVYAGIWDDLWARPEQQASDAFNRGEFSRAQDKSSDPLLKGSSWYRQGDYQQALDQYAQSDTADSHYNRGNTLAKLQKYEEAISAYDAALKHQPDMDDALANKKMIEDILKQQEQKSENQQDSDSENSDDQESQNDESESQDSESQDSENGETDKESESDDQDPASSDEQKDSESEQNDKESTEQQSELSEEQRKKIAEEQKQALEQAQQQALDPQALKKLQEQENLSAEQQQAVEQWLRRIPDDPGGLMRRKFRSQYQRMNLPKSDTADEEW